ncbi:hypothetical protein ACW9I6_01255 [Pseudomonas sp. SDO5522_S412]
MIDSKSLKHSSNAYQVARQAWDAAVSALANADTVQTTPLEIQRLHNEAQQTLEAVFAAGAELAEEVADAIGRAERAPRE